MATLFNSKKVEASGRPEFLNMSERSPQVQSANWKEETGLQKTLQLLNKTEKNVVNQIATEQRVIHKRFLRQLSLSRLAYARMMGDREQERALRAQNNEQQRSRNAEDNDLMLKKILNRKSRSFGPGLDGGPVRKPLPIQPPTPAFPEYPSKPSRSKSLGDKTCLNFDEIARLLRPKSVVSIAEPVVELRPTTAFELVTPDGVSENDEDGDLEKASTKPNDVLEPTEVKMKQDLPPINCDNKKIRKEPAKQKRAYSISFGELRGSASPSDRNLLDDLEDLPNVSTHRPCTTQFAGTMGSSSDAGENLSKSSKLCKRKGKKHNHGYKIPSTNDNAYRNVSLKDSQLKWDNMEERMRGFCDSIKSLEMETNIHKDYYSSRMMETSRIRRMQQIPLVLPGTPDDEWRENIQNSRVPNMTFKPLDYDSVDEYSSRSAYIEFPAPVSQVWAPPVME
ncbi:uncharacterized protein LOC106167973 [Lingula anatina]|uniref:Uncharacterized protein LOC106167973 n=1 Tax=Lingula anatina TaxID=7574 RepID=A0A1S3IWJ7_LINAN|nr:uncharacterized protein LOC106167973 [Lingula anatina]|eukprot:XP_013402341.1 uncharacterized protein LOC106167973 [Lingula anatina]